MVVKKSKGKKAKKKKKSNVIGQRSKVSELKLPKEAKEANHQFTDYATLIYGRPGVGKTSFMAEFPDAVMFSCERVSKGITCFDFNSEEGGVHSWEVFKQGVKLLKKTSRFQTVCIDTIDAAYAQCLDYVCKMRGISYPDNDDFGKSWNAVKAEFSSVLDEIWETGRGIVFSSHASENEIKSASGEKFTRIQPSMSGQAYKYIKAKTDFVFYVDYIKTASGKTQRVLFTEGDEIVEAKHADVTESFPQFLPYKKGKGFEVVLAAFSGEDVGLDPETIKPSKLTGTAATELLEKNNRDRINKRIAKSKKKKRVKKK